MTWPNAHLAAIAVLVGCATTPTFPVAEPFSEGPLRWQPCPPLPPIPSEPPGECSRTRVPLRWDERGGREIEIAVRRFEPATPRRGTLWLLDGGPGGTGNTFNTPAWRSISVDRGLAMLIPTHRGSGFSTPLACPAEEAADSDLGAWVSSREAASCARALEATWGPELGAFSSYEAARDLAHLMARERRAGEPIYVLGGSYGTLWAQRLIELDPALVDAYILEGLVPIAADFITLSRNADEAAAALLDQCSASTACAAHFPAGPRAAAAELVAADLAGHGCAARLGVDLAARQRLFATVFVADPRLRPLLAPLILRWSRCAPSDLAVLAAALARFPGLATEPAPARTLEGTLADPVLRNLRLADNILQLELVRSSPDAAQIEALERGLLASLGHSRDFQRVRQIWPALVEPHAQIREVHPAVPMLLFAGGLDAQTPPSWSAAVARQYAAASQHLVVVPTAGHMTYSFARSTDGVNCTVELWKRFLDAPSAAPELSCFARIPPLDLGADQPDTLALADQMLGTRDVWGTAR